jgi:hypothetical protein
MSCRKWHSSSEFALTRITRRGRRGHNKTYFAARWRTRMAMTLARRGLFHVCMHIEQ